MKLIFIHLHVNVIPVNMQDTNACNMWITCNVFASLVLLSYAHIYQYQSTMWKDLPILYWSMYNYGIIKCSQISAITLSLMQKMSCLLLNLIPLFLCLLLIFLFSSTLTQLSLWISFQCTCIGKCNQSMYLFYNAEIHGVPTRNMQLQLKD